MPNRYSFSVLTPKSKAFSVIAYDADTYELSVTFRSRQTWVYRDVPGMFARGLRDVKSKGRYYNDNIKNVFACSLVPSVSDCDETLTEALQASLAAVRRNLHGVDLAPSDGGSASLAKNRVATVRS